MSVYVSKGEWPSWQFFRLFLHSSDYSRTDRVILSCVVVSVSSFGLLVRFIRCPYHGKTGRDSATPQMGGYILFMEGVMGDPEFDRFMK